MQKLSNDFNWRESPSHIELLKSFTKARSIQQVVGWQHLKQTLKEGIEDAIGRLTRDGALIPAGVEEGLNSLFQIVQLKKLLQERNLRISGAKSELVERLVIADHAWGEQVVRKSKVMKCSEAVLVLISNYEERKESDCNSAKERSFESFKNNNVKEAYNAYVTFQRKYSNAQFESNPFHIGDLQYILTSKPRILGDIAIEDLRLLRAAACMQSLWNDKSPENWLPDTFKTCLKNNRLAINYLATNARIRYDIDGFKEYTKQVRVAFSPWELDSCDLCQSLNGKVFEIDDFPELPMIGCTSETGCKCHISPVYEEDNDDNENEFFGVRLELDKSQLVENPVEKLRQLKQMLDDNLITQDEYNKKKSEVLARF